MVEIRNLRQYYIKKDVGLRTKFIYVVDENFYYDEMDLPGYINERVVLKIVREMMADGLIHMQLKETLDKINAPDVEFKFENTDFRDLVFDEDILDNASDLYIELKRFILKNWRDEFEMDYCVYEPLKYIKIHDYSDKKTLYNHYFDSLDEFRQGIGFLDYVKSKVDFEISKDPVAYIDTDKLIDYYVLDDTISVEGLRYALSKMTNKKIDVNERSNASIWKLYGYYFGLTHDLVDAEAESFAYLLSRLATFTTDNPIRKNEVFKESVIEDRVSQMDLELWVEGYTVESRIRHIFNNLFEIYSGELDLYKLRDYPDFKSDFTDWWCGSDDEILFSQSQKEKEFKKHEKFIEKLTDLNEIH